MIALRASAFIGVDSLSSTVVVIEHGDPVQTVTTTALSNSHPMERQVTVLGMEHEGTNAAVRVATSALDDKCAAQRQDTGDAMQQKADSLLHRNIDVTQVPIPTNSWKHYAKECFDRIFCCCYGAQYEARKIERAEERADANSGSQAVLEMH